MCHNAKNFNKLPAKLPISAYKKIKSTPMALWVPYINIFYPTKWEKRSLAKNVYKMCTIL